MRRGLQVSLLATAASLLIACVPPLPGASLGESPDAAAPGRGGSAGGASGGGATSAMGAGGATGMGGPGTGGSSFGGGMSAGPLPCPGIATFDQPDLQGFALAIDHLSGNPAGVNRSGWAKLAFDGTEGDPSPGSLRIDAPFNGYSQFIDVRRTLGGAAAQNWTNYKLHVRVRLASGGGPDPGDAAGVELYVLAAGGASSCASYGAVPRGNDWNDYALDLNCPSVGPSNVTAYGVSVVTSAGENPMPTVNLTSAVIFVDSFWLEGSCPTPGTDGGGGGPDASGAMQ